MSAEEQFLSLDGESPPPPPIGSGLGLDGQAKMPSIEEILAMIDDASSIAEEEKASIKEDILRFHQEKESLKDYASTLEGYVAEASADSSFFSPQVVLFIVLVTLIALIIGFFAYKLIRTEQDKIQAKEAKRQARTERRTKRKNA